MLRMARRALTEVRGIPMERKKVLIMGDSAAGKTSLLLRFTEDHYPEEYTPTIFSNHAKEFEVDGLPVELALWDTSGNASLQKLHRVSFPKTDVTIVCYSVDCPQSLENVQNWVSEVNDVLKFGCAILLVANKVDLRQNRETVDDLRKRGLRTVTAEQGRAMAERVGAFGFLECSAKYKEGVQLVFESATRAARAKSTRKEKPSCCSI